MESLANGAVTRGTITSLPKYKQTIKNPDDLNKFKKYNSKPQKLIVNFSNEPATFVNQLDKLAKAHKNVESLTLNFANHMLLNDEVILEISRCLTDKLPHLKSFTFKENTTSQMTAHGYQALALLLKSLKSLTELNLELKTQVELPKDTLANILHKIKGIRTLKKLDLKGTCQLRKGQDVGDQILRDLAKNLRRYTRLTELSLCLANSTYIDPTSITYFAKSLAHLSRSDSLQVYV